MFKKLVAGAAAAGALALAVSLAPTRIGNWPDPHAASSSEVTISAAAADSTDGPVIVKGSDQQSSTDRIGNWPDPYRF